jgi:exopolysaccharide biosynthesis protein
MENGEIVTYSPESIKGSESFYNKRHPRTIIGVSKNAKGRAEKVFFIVIDGRFPAQADGATIKECADIAYFLGCDEALNLDGGGSSTIWSTLTGVINHPYDNRVFDHEGERRVPNIIIAK